MKRLLLSFILGIVYATSEAAPVFPGQWQNLILANGNTIWAELVGDECCSYYRSEDGKCFRLNTNTRFFEQVSINTLHQETAAMRTSMVEARAKRRTSKLKTTTNTKSSEIIGSFRGLVILVEFRDLKMVMTKPYTTEYSMKKAS